MKRKYLFLVFISVIALSGCDQKSGSIDHQFTIAMIPDTQNMVDYLHQRQAGFAIDSADLYIEQMQYIADNSENRGGEIAFATSVGDVWQHLDVEVDPAHYERGLRKVPITPRIPPEELLSGRNNFEIPVVIKGYDLIEETGIPFSVAPGNHDYTTGWMHNPYPDDPNPRDRMRAENILPNMHLGGYDVFNGVFGPQSKYFKGKNWYISSFHGGVNSAQIFDAGGYKFLHLAFEMQAGDDVLGWAQSVINENPGLPTIISTHDYLNPRGERLPSPSYDLDAVDPLAHNSAEEIWNEFISKNDQIFMVLSGHQLGQAIKTSINDKGNAVYQILADYQRRGQAANPPVGQQQITGIGDGWLRLMEFDTAPSIPVIKVRTYSTFYKKYSSELAEYSSWYRNMEQPGMTDQEFQEADNYDIILNDFKIRFGEPE
ncbi:MAG: serine/threonine protein phosphatase [Kordiimonadaceae bacterium]|nr:serine/threonine protein phosphatase [Kordiimonadaceae bacterium]